MERSFYTWKFVLHDGQHRYLCPFITMSERGPQFREKKQVKSFLPFSPKHYDHSAVHS